MEALKELEQFLDEKTRLDVKNEALQHVLGVTGTPEGRLLLRECDGLLRQLIKLNEDWSCESIAKDACFALVNLSADAQLVPALLKQGAISSLLLRCVLESSSPVADPACMAVCNLTRGQQECEQAWQILQQCEQDIIDRLISALSNLKYNEKGASLHYLAPLLCNLSQLKPVRRLLLDRERCILQRLLPFTQFENSSVRRGGIIGTLRNCCFDTDYHDWLLSSEVDLLPALLLPLAGPEEFSDEEMDQLPPDLQFLGEEKQRERDPDLRKLLLEAITRLCATRETRHKIREERATYLIIRELHKWEKDRVALLACENLVDLLIRTEEEIGADDLRALEVPEDLTQKFSEEDKTYLALE